MCVCRNIEIFTSNNICSCTNVFLYSKLLGQPGWPLTLAPVYLQRGSATYVSANLSEHFATCITMATEGHNRSWVAITATGNPFIGFCCQAQLPPLILFVLFFHLSTCTAIERKSYVWNTTLCLLQIELSAVSLGAKSACGRHNRNKRHFQWVLFSSCSRQTQDWRLFTLNTTMSDNKVKKASNFTTSPSKLLPYPILLPLWVGHGIILRLDYKSLVFVLNQSNALNLHTL